MSTSCISSYRCLELASANSLRPHFPVQPLLNTPTPSSGWLWQSSLEPLFRTHSWTHSTSLESFGWIQSATSLVVLSPPFCMAWKPNARKKNCHTSTLRALRHVQSMFKISCRRTLDIWWIQKQRSRVHIANLTLAMLMPRRLITTTPIDGETGQSWFVGLSTCLPSGSLLGCIDRSWGNGLAGGMVVHRPGWSPGAWSWHMSTSPHKCHYYSIAGLLMPWALECRTQIRRRWKLAYHTRGISGSLGNSSTE